MDRSCLGFAVRDACLPSGKGALRAPVARPVGGWPRLCFSLLIFVTRQLGALGIPPLLPPCCWLSKAVLQLEGTCLAWGCGCVGEGQCALGRAVKSLAAGCFWCPVGTAFHRWERCDTVGAGSMW